MANNRPMTEDEKKLLQTQHRMEAIEARNCQKERKARTRRLIQIGAVLESARLHRRTLLWHSRFSIYIMKTGLWCMQSLRRNPRFI